MYDTSISNSPDVLHPTRRHVSDATEVFHWVLETHVSDSSATGISRHYYIDIERTTWIYDQILVYRKWHGASPRHNEKLIKANYMKSIQNRSKGLTLLKFNRKRFLCCPNQ